MRKGATQTNSLHSARQKANILNDVERNAWDQQPGETDHAYSYFCKFIKLPVSLNPGSTVERRNISELARQEGMHEQQLRRWADQFSWRTRADAYDDFLRTPSGIDEMTAKRTYGQNLRWLS